MQVSQLVSSAKRMWRGLPDLERYGSVIAVEVLAVVLIWALLDHSLAAGLAVFFIVLWLPKLEPVQRVGVEIAVVAGFAIAAISNSSVRAVPFVLAAAFALSWIPSVTRLEGKASPELRRFVIRPTSKFGLAVGLLALAIAYPYFVGHMFTIPLFGAFPDVGTGVVMLVYVMMAIGLNMVVGYAGLLDLGYVAFYAIGAYTAAWFASVQFANHNVHFGAVGVGPTVPGIHVSVWLLLILAAILTAIVGIVIGLPTLRLRGDYLAIVTLGFGEILPQVARNGDNLFGTGFNLTNGPNGITPIDPPGFGNNLHDITGGVLPSNYSAALNSDNLYFWTAIALVLFTVFCSIRLRDSRLGRAWIAIREDEVAASAMGVPLMRTKTWAYAAGAFFGGIAGAYYASFKSATFPQDFFFNISVFILCMVILGGMGSIWGVILGASFLAYLNQSGLANIGAWMNGHLGTHLDVPAYTSGIFGVILVVVMLFRPQGLIPSARRKAEFEEGVADEPLYDVSH
jgi:branched-chain amino acid transport system permease protein